ncbi:MAG: PDDEXK nuclease domain-containing protein [Kiritimatiellae bacterium]|nr:PDDEXK nuclease domain-containing protein [Kiritimatiellia bacterium]
MARAQKQKNAKKGTPVVVKDVVSAQAETPLLTDIRDLIAICRQRVAAGVNAELSLLYWNVGKRINDEVLGNERAEYGKRVLGDLCARLVQEFGRGWGEKQVRRMMQFARAFPEKENVVSLIRQLSWTHLLVVIPMDDPLKRDFYIELCRLERWSVRTLRERIDAMLYERTAISKKPALTIKNDIDLLKNTGKMTPDMVFRDPYFLDFLGLADTYSERDLESAILTEIQKFITEFGDGFAFVARQKRISVDNRDYYIDLIFYHRRLRRLVAIELKLGEFEASHKGQMELYLRWLQKNEQLDGEEEPIGLILCAGKNDEHVELLQLDRSNIRVAQYLTVLPPKELLLAKFHQAVELAKERLAQKKDDPQKPCDQL